MGDETDAGVGTEERSSRKVAFRLRVADQAFLRGDGDAGVCGVYRIPAGVDTGDERSDHGGAGVGADPLESRFCEIPRQAEGQGTADVRSGSADAAHAGGRAAVADG